MVGGLGVAARRLPGGTLRCVGVDTAGACRAQSAVGPFVRDVVAVDRSWLHFINTIRLVVVSLLKKHGRAVPIDEQRLDPRAADQFDREHLGLGHRLARRDLGERRPIHEPGREVPDFQ